MQSLSITSLAIVFGSLGLLGSALLVLIRAGIRDWMAARVKASTEVSRGEVFRSKIVYPDVRFNYNQMSAYLILHNYADLQLFNNFVNRTLSLEERKEVLSNVKLNDIWK